jgi:hypothetical protein
MKDEGGRTVERGLPPSFPLPENSKSEPAVHELGPKFVDGWLAL